MKKAIITLAVGKHEQLLEIAAPSFKAFAKRHKWDLFRATDIGKDRPPAWYKLIGIIELLKSYDEVLLLDADTVIVDGREDLTAPAEAWQAMVMHKTGDGEVPNTGVWITRPPMIPILKQAWEMEKYLMHGWWEQAAILELMGYQVPQPTHLIEPTDLYHNTFWLDPAWNVHKWHKPQPEQPKILHATMYPDRIATMKEWAKQAEGWINALDND